MKTMLLEDVIEVLTGAGLTVELGGTTGSPRQNGGAVLRVGEGTLQREFRVVSRKRAPYPGELAALEPRSCTCPGSSLLVAPYVSVPLGEALNASGWSWVDLSGNLDLQAPGFRWRQRLTTRSNSRAEPRIPSGRAATAIVRAILLRSDLREPIHQSELAKVAEVSQARVSQILRRLEALELLVREGRRLRVVSPEPLLDLFVGGPGPLSGTVEYGWTDAPLRDVASSATARDAEVLVSADVGLERLPSYTESSVLVLYGRAVPDWTAIGVAPAPATDANVVWRVPEDLTLLTRSSASVCGGSETRSVDPLQLVADLRSLGGAQRLEAAELVRSWFLKQHARPSRHGQCRRREGQHGGAS